MALEKSWDLADSDEELWERVASTEPDPGASHFLRWIGLYGALLLANSVLVGLLWSARALSRTGYRKRDVLLLFVPVLGAVVAITATWRYTARSVYWSPRHDRPSTVLTSPWRPVAIGFGWAAGLAAIAAIIVAIEQGSGWTSSGRNELRAELIKQGISDARAKCIVSHFVGANPDGPPSAGDPRITSVGQAAAASCASR